MAEVTVETPLGAASPPPPPRSLGRPGGEPALEFAARDAAGSVAFGTRREPIPHLVWQLDASRPSEVLVRLLDGSGARPGPSLSLDLGAALLPDCGGLTTPDGAFLALVTADGRLHRLALAEEQGGLSCDHLAIDLRATFDKAGAATAIAALEDSICVGTAGGTVVSIDVSLEVSTQHELKMGYALPRVLGALFHAPKDAPVVQLLPYDHLDLCLLCVLHANSQVRFWDIRTRSLVHTVDLVPPELAGGLKPELVRAIEEPVDASLGVLLVHFRDAVGHGQLHTYSVMIEQRGDRSFMFNVENGARLLGGEARLVDMRPVAIDRRTVGAWVLYEHPGGSTTLHLIPLAFSEEAVRPTSSTSLGHSALEAAVATADPVALAAVWQRAADGSLAVSGVTVDAVVCDACCALLAHPTWLNAGALAAAVQTTLGTPFDDAAPAGRLVVAAGEAVAALHGERGGGLAELLALWLSLLGSYADELSRRMGPVGFADGAPATTVPVSPVLVRRGGTLSCVAAGSPSEALAAGGGPLLTSIPPDARAALSAALASQSPALGGSLTILLASASARLGADPSAVARDLLDGAALGVAGPGSAGWRKTVSAHAVDLRRLRAAPLDLAASLEGVAGVGVSATAPLRLSSPEHEPPASALDQGPLAHALLSRLHDSATATASAAWRLTLLAGSLRGTGDLPTPSSWTTMAAARGAALDQARHAASWAWACSRLVTEEDASGGEARHLLGSLRLDDWAPPKRPRHGGSLNVPVAAALVSAIVAEAERKGGDTPSRVLVDYPSRLLALAGIGEPGAPWLALTRRLAARGHFSVAHEFLSLLPTSIGPARLLALSWTSLGRGDGPWLEGLSAWMRADCASRQGVLPDGLLEAVDTLGERLLGGATLLRELGHLDLTLSALEHRGMHDPALEVACLWAAEGAEAPGVSSDAWRRAEEAALAQDRVEDAYVCVVSRPPEQQPEGVRELALRAKSDRATRALVSLPLADVVRVVPVDGPASQTSLLQAAVSALRLRSASDGLLDRNNAHIALYRLLLRRGCFQAAADSLFEHALRLQAELRPTEAVLRLVATSLEGAVGALELTSGGAATSPDQGVESARRELARVRAKVTLVASGGDGGAHVSDDATLIDALLDAGLFPEAAILVPAVLRGSALTEAAALVLERFASSAARSSYEGEDSAEESWEALRVAYLRLREEGARDPSPAIRGVFATSTDSALPPWLEEAALRDASAAADLARLCIRYGRPLEGARAAHALLDRLAGVPIRQAHVPHDLLALLLRRLAEGGHATERTSLERRVRILQEN